MNASTMRRERVTADPDWYEPYNISLAIKAGGLVYVSGQAGFDPDGSTVGNGDFEPQARQVFATSTRCSPKPAPVSPTWSR